MANKIQINSTIRLTGETGVSPSISFSISADQKGSNFTLESQLIDQTTPTALDVGTAISGGTLGYLVIRNEDKDNFVDVATDDAMANKVAHILPGHGVAILPVAGQSYWLKSDTAPVLIAFLAIEL